MYKTISDETKQLIKYLIAKGVSIARIAEQAEVSIDTVKRIKKEVGSDETLPQGFNHLDYNPKDREMQERLEREKILFEDREEGWVYSVDVLQEASRKNIFSKWWTGIVYEESAPEWWKEQLQATGNEIAISPLHDKDKWNHDSPEKTIVCSDGVELTIPKGALYKTGDPKKAHWHIIIKTDVRVSFKDMNKMFHRITNGPMIQKCTSLKGTYEYFIHLNNPERYQYDRDEIEEYNGFTVEPTDKDRKMMFQEIVQVCEAECIEDYSALMRRYIDSYEFLNVISLKAFALSKLVDSIWRRNHPDYAKKVEIIDKEKKSDGKTVIYDGCSNEQRRD